MRTMVRLISGEDGCEVGADRESECFGELYILFSAPCHELKFRIATEEQQGRSATR